MTAYLRDEQKIAWVTVNESLAVGTCKVYDKDMVLIPGSDGSELTRIGVDPVPPNGQYFEMCQTDADWFDSQIDEQFKVDVPKN